MSLKTSTSARPQVCAPWVFAPIQRAPFPACPVTQVSPWHPVDSHVKVEYSGWFTVFIKIYDLHAIIFTVICSSTVWPTIVRTSHYLLMMHDFSNMFTVVWKLFIQMTKLDQFWSETQWFAAGANVSYWWRLCMCQYRCGWMCGHQSVSGRSVY